MQEPSSIFPATCIRSIASPLHTDEPSTTFQPRPPNRPFPASHAHADLAPPFDYEAALSACVRGERFALRALYEREGRWLLGVALRIVRDRSRAEDVLQDAFLQVWLHASTFNPDLGSARGWIYTVVRHRALKEVRDIARSPSVEPEALHALSDAAQVQADDAAARGIDAESLERCLQRLEASRRTCVMHAFVDGYTHEQIAERLQTPLGTVKSWIRRSLASLRECMA